MTGCFAPPAPVVVSRAIPARYRTALADLVVAGFAGVDGDGVEVHLRSRPPRVLYAVAYRAGDASGVRHTRRRAEAERFAALTGGVVERKVDDRLGQRMSGCAYYSLPHVAAVDDCTRYLVTLKVPQDLDRLPYPVTLRYHHGGTVLRTAPAIEVHDWREEFVHLVAHEACHVGQFRTDLPKSEVAAERWALDVVLRRRSGAPAG